MRKMQLEQIKTFYYEHTLLNKTNIDIEVNEYVIKMFNKTRNFPKIETNSKFISVICNVLVEVEKD
jgi:hypothetical protein